MVVDPSNARNVPKPHIDFAGKFHGQEDHSEAEIALWDKRVEGSFQENAWVDEPTNILWLEKVMKPINTFLEENHLHGILMEDNLASHKTAGSRDAFARLLTQFGEEAIWFLPNLTGTLQPVDCHIGKRYCSLRSAAHIASLIIQCS